MFRRRWLSACAADRTLALIQVVVLNANLDPVPGVPVQVSWPGGSDQFFTGFQPNEGPGYGDFTMATGVSYEVTLAAGSPTVSGLQLEACPAADGGQLGGWRLTYQDLRLSAEPDNSDGE